MRTTAWHIWIGALPLLAAASCTSTTGEPVTPQPTASASATAPATATATAAAVTRPITPPRADTTLIKRQVLFGNPERTAVELSPDGKQISYLAPKDGVMNVW